MKIATITFHRAHNYGAVLQAYALQNYLILSGYDTEILDYSLNEIQYQYNLIYTSYHPKKYRRLLSCIKNIIKLPLKIGKLKRYNKFNNFINKKLILSKKIRSYKKLNSFSNKYDVIIVGSDQVWNPEVTKGINPYFFLDFGSSDKIRISYAASIGKSELTKEEKKDIRKKIKKFNSVSVRENDAAKILSESFDRSIAVVIDPTLLLTRKDYKKIEEKVENLENYILVYTTEMSQKIIDFAKKLSKYNNLKIVSLNRVNEKEWEYFEASPGEFLTLIKNAKYVITNSFHGTCFSIIYEKDFIVIPHTTRGVRITELLDKSNLSDRIIKSNIDASLKIIYHKIDYKIVNESLKSHINFSKKFLNNSLK